MSDYLSQSHIAPQACLLLGDNFYGPLPQGENDPRWQAEFEQMYPRDTLPFPFYVALGNHDYEDFGTKLKAEFAYGKNHADSRWKLPAKWYRVDFPEKAPLVSVLIIDSDRDRLSADEWNAQKAWLHAEVERSDPKKWVIVAAHHPLFSNGLHGDDPEMIATIAPSIFTHKIDFYLCGHDHDLEHLQIADWPPSFLIAGGGGAVLRPMKRNDRGPFSRSLAGFVHLHFTPENATIKFVDTHGEILHWAERSVDGTVTVKSTTGCDVPPPSESPTPTPAASPNKR